MNVAKITVSIDADLLNSVDSLIQSRVFRNRSQAVQLAIQEKVNRLGKTRLARACSFLDPVEEQALADEGLASEASGWPEY